MDCMLLESDGVKRCTKGLHSSGYQHAIYWLISSKQTDNLVIAAVNVQNLLPRCTDGVRRGCTALPWQAA
jgi:hypothetical protein